MQFATIIEQNWLRVQAEIVSACDRVGREHNSVTLVAVTKTVDYPAIRALYDLGVRDFAENRPQVLWKKRTQLPHDIRWHLIGHLQTNKVRRTIPFVHCLHSLDRWPLAVAVSEESGPLPRPLGCLVQLNLTGEEAKHGFSEAEIPEVFPKLLELPGLEIQGLMTMARLEDDAEQCRPTFAALRNLRDQLQAEFSLPLPVLSMGMSHDFSVAIEEGATLVRVGSALFEGLDE